MNSKHLLTNNLIVFPSNEGKFEICDFLYQTCRILAKNNLVIVINIQKSKSLKEILFHARGEENTYFQLISCDQNIYYFTPVLLLPFRRFAWIVRLNIILNIISLQCVLAIFFRQYNRKLLWFFFPQLSYLHQYFSQSWETIYDVIDYYTSPSPTLNQELTQQKQYLLKVAKLTTTISVTLKTTYLTLLKRPIYVVPQGFNLRLFEKKLEFKTLIKSKGKPIIGFIGHLNERLDFKLLQTIIVRNQQWQFVFVGPKETNINVALTENYQQVEKILQFSNVTWIDQQPKENIPGLIQEFSVCMIPYDLQYEFNRYCYPMKIYEYFYMGKPVISTPIEELKKLTPYVIIGDSAASWEKHIKSILKTKWPQKYISQEKALAEKNSWQSKIEAISSYLTMP